MHVLVIVYLYVWGKTSPPFCLGLRVFFAVGVVPDLRFKAIFFGTRSHGNIEFQEWILSYLYVHCNWILEKSSFEI